MIIPISNPDLLKKILEHYVSKIERLESEKETPLNTKSTLEFLSDGKNAVKDFITYLEKYHHVMGVDTDEMPSFKEICCLAITQYLKDMEADKKRLSDELGLYSIHLGALEKEIKRVNSLEESFKCDS